MKQKQQPKKDYIEQFAQTLTNEESNLDYHMDLSTQRVGEFVIAFYRQNLEEHNDHLLTVKKAIQVMAHQLYQYQIPEIFTRFSLVDVFESNTYHDIEAGMQYQITEQNNKSINYFKKIEQNNWGQASNKSKFFEDFDDEPNNDEGYDFDNEPNQELDYEQNYQPTEPYTHSPNLDRQALSLGRFARQINDFLIQAGVDADEADTDSIFMASWIALPAIYTLLNKQAECMVKVPNDSFGGENLPTGHYLFKLNINSHDFIPKLVEK